jgi:hypothetical protein
METESGVAYTKEEVQSASFELSGVVVGAYNIDS